MIQARDFKHTKQGLCPELAPYSLSTNGSLAQLSRLAVCSLCSPVILFVSLLMFAYAVSSPPPPFCALDALLRFKDSLLCACPLEALLLLGTHMVRQVGELQLPRTLHLRVFLSSYFLRTS